MLRFRKLFWVSYLKTIYINFKLLPYKQAIKLPIVVTRATTIGSLAGKIIINCPCRFGLIRFGFLHTDFYSWKGNRTLLTIDGTFIVNGDLQFGVGCGLIIDKGATLEMNKTTAVGALCKIICRDKMVVAENFRMGWESQLIDTNFHYVKDMNTGKIQRRTKPIIIGRNNWIGNRSSIMPGTKTPNYFITTSYTILNKDYTEAIPDYSLVGGLPAKLIKKDLYRIPNRDEPEIDGLFKETDLDFIQVEANQFSLD